MGKFDRSQNTLQACSSSEWNLSRFFMVLSILCLFFSCRLLICFSPLVWRSPEDHVGQTINLEKLFCHQLVEGKPCLLEKRGRRKERDGSIEIGSVTKLQGYQCTVVCCEKCLFFFFQLWAKLIVLNKTKAKRATFHAVMKMWYRGVIMNTGVNRMIITNRTWMHTKPSAHKGKDQAARN